MTASAGEQLPDDLLDAAAARQPIHTIMGTGFATVEQHDSVRDVARELSANDIGAVLVSSPVGPVGIVSERDVDLDAEQVKTLMSVDLVTASATDPIAVVGRQMVRAGVRHVAVRDGHKVIGVVSMRDVLDALLA
jgi:CBS domain-containing protein